MKKQEITLYKFEAFDNNLLIIIECVFRTPLSPAFCLYLMNELAEGSIQSWTDDVNWVIYPLLNPDGYIFSYEQDRFWRKNRRNNENRAV